MLNKEKFLSYLLDNFSAMENHFTYELVENIIDYGLKNHDTTVNGLKWFLTSIIPELEENEIEMFIEG